MPLDGEPPDPVSLARAALLDHLPKDAILARYENASGKEVSSGKFANPESSAALAANAFGFFLLAPAMLSLPDGLLAPGSANGVTLEAEMRFPWSGGRHPWLDVGIETDTRVIGVESKRYEPFRDAKRSTFSAAYYQPVWGNAMAGFEQMRDDLVSGRRSFDNLDAAQLVKHAFGLRTQAARRGKEASLVYLYAEPKTYPDGRVIDPAVVARHRQEVEIFAGAVADPPSDVEFHVLRYADLLASWACRDENCVCSHAVALQRRFDL